MWRSIGGLALLTLVWAISRHAWRGGDDHDDAANLARQHIKNGWKPLTSRKDS